MRRVVVAVAVAFWAAAAQTGIVNDFNDILFWAGSGTNQAAFVLDFGTAAPQAAPAAVAWGYRWNGTASLADMMFALAGTLDITGTTAPPVAVGSDPRLGIQAEWNAGWGDYFMHAISFDQVGLPAGWSQEVRSLVNDYENNLGVGQYVAAASGGPWPAGGLLGLSSFGPVGTPLVAGGWYGYVVAELGVDQDGWAVLPETYVFSQPTAAVPEPAAIALAAAGIALAGLGLRRRHARATLGRAAPRP